MGIIFDPDNHHIKTKGSKIIEINNIRVPEDLDNTVEQIKTKPSKPTHNHSQEQGGFEVTEGVMFMRPEDY